MDSTKIQPGDKVQTPNGVGTVIVISGNTVIVDLICTKNGHCFPKNSVHKIDINK